MKYFCVLIAIFTQPNLLWAWSEHQLITRYCGHRLDFLKLPVRFVPFEKAISSLGFKNSMDFNIHFKLNKKWVFNNKHEESSKISPRAIDILSTYSSEPDWGADHNLFDDDQYPELWTNDTPFVSQKNGDGSSGLRHMYFPGKFIWVHPIRSFQIPFRPLGEAPFRAKLFFELSQKFFEHKLPYWGYRFLGWSFHYIQDLFQPFHSNQSPSKRFIRFMWLPPFIDVSRTAEQVAYYHLSYEKFLSEYLTSESALTRALDSSRAIEIRNETLDLWIIHEAVHFSSLYAPGVGELTIKLFSPFSTSMGKASTFVESKVWEMAVSKDEKVKSQMIEHTLPLFLKMGGILKRLLIEVGHEIQ